MQRAITVLLQAITGPYEAAMGRASAKTSAFGASARGAQAQTGALGGSLGGIGGKLLSAGGVVYALGQGIDLLTSYEDALVGVGKTTGLAGDDLGRLGDELTELAGRIEGSAESMLQIGQIAAQLGVGSDEIVEFTEVVAGIASATDLTTEAAATDMARLMNIMSLPMSEIERLGSTIVGLGNSMATTEPEILSMAQRIAGAGDLAGFAASEVLALAAAASSVGLEAEAGGTAISRVIREIETSTQVGGEKLEMFAAIAGQSAADFAAAWSADPTTAFEQFVAGLGRVRDEGGNVAEIFDTLGLDGIRVSDSLLRLSGDTERVAAAFDAANGFYEENIALAEEVEAANGRLSVAIDNLWDELKEQGRGLLGNEDGARAAAVGVNALTDSVGLLADEWKRMQDPRSRIDPLIEWGLSAAEAIGLLGEKSQAGAADVAMLNSAAASGAGAVEDLADAHWDAAAGAEEQLRTNTELAEYLRGQTDPYFALQTAVEKVTKAQKGYDTAVEESGAGSDEAAEASWELYESLIGLTDASLRAGGGIDHAVDQVWALYSSGQITRDAADQLIERLEGLKTTAEELSGDYRMQILLDMDPSDRAMIGRLWDMQRSGAASYTYTPDPEIPIEARAAGGPVSPDGLYLVGEEGPELFSPKAAGRIIPATETAAALGGGGQPQIIDQRSFTAQLVGTDREDALMALRKMSLRYS